MVITLKKCDASGKTSEQIAIVDLKKIAIESEAGKYIEKKIEEINDESSKDLLDLEMQIKAIDSNKSSNEDARKIEDMQLSLYETVREKRNQISNAYKKAISELEIEIKKAISHVAKKSGIKIVLAYDAVIYNSDDCVDITEKVIVRLNKTCGKIDVVLTN